jgi:hypothetical protein
MIENREIKSLDDFKRAELLHIIKVYKTTFNIYNYTKLNKEELKKLINKHINFLPDLKTFNIKHIDNININNVNIKKQKNKPKKIKQNEPKEIKQKSDDELFNKVFDKKEPKEDIRDPDIVSMKLQKLIMLTPMKDLMKVLFRLKFRGRLQTNKMLASLQILQNFNTIPKMEELIKALEIQS